MIVALVGLAFVSAITHLYAEARGPRWLVYFAKPFTTTMLIVLAALGPSSAYKHWIVAGLIFSLAGDVFLMLPRDSFIAGLLGFLVAHLAYSYAFGFHGKPLLLVPYVLAALLVLRVLWPRLGKLRAPVLVYVAALVVMAWLAAARATILCDVPAIGAAIGAALFVVSDATLAIKRFHTPFAHAQRVVMSTYVVAQALIALSVYR